MSGSPAATITGSSALPPLTAPDSVLVNRLHPSPNIEPRKHGLAPDLVLLHYTGMTSAESAIDWLSRPESKVSAHYVVDEAGAVTQLVAEAHRAWHAGLSSWRGETDINSLSIGIEIQNPGHELGYHDFPEAQVAAVESLVRDIARRHRIRPERVLAHSDVAPARKIDPGEKFPWARLARAGIGHWVEPVAAGRVGVAAGTSDGDVALMQGLLREYGYGCADHGRLDEATVKVVAAFQRHFRPERVDGLVDASSIATLERLIAALPRPLTV